MKKDRNCNMQYAPYGMMPNPMVGPMPTYQNGNMQGMMNVPAYQNNAYLSSNPNSIQDQINNIQGQINMLDKRLTNLENTLTSNKETYNNTYNNTNYHVM